MTQDFKAMLKELKKEYLQQLPDKIKELAALHKKGASQLLREEFHKLKGNGKTYGVASVSELCAEAEQLFDKNPSLGLTLTPKIVHLLQKIQTAEASDQCFTIGGDPDFLELLKLKS